MKIAFDIDDTLIIPSVVTGNRDVPNYDTIAIFNWFQAQGHTMILWSGSGMDWAQTWGEKLGLLNFTVQRKEKDMSVDIAFDDCDVELAKVNVKVKRINNSISRKEWNETKKNNNPLSLDTCSNCGKEIQVDESFGFKEGKCLCQKCWI